MSASSAAIYAGLLRDTYPDATHAASWAWLLERIHRYPHDKRIEPLKAPRGDDRAKPLVALVLDIEGERESVAVRPARLTCFDGSTLTVLGMSDHEGDAARVASALFSKAHRGALFVTWGGARFDFHLMLRYWVRHWADAGYTVRPIAAEADVRALVIGRGRNRWWLCDLQVMTGLPAERLDELATTLGVVPQRSTPSAVYLHRVAAALQDWTLRTFGTRLRPTLGGLALASARRTMPADLRRWRTPALGVTVCRDGQAFGGGYVFAQRYSGPAHKADVNRMYTWALSEPLPLSGGLGAWGERGEGGQGIYMTRVVGPGTIPAYLSVWEGVPQGFARRYWSGDTCVALIPSHEFDGLRALGYRLYPSYGYQFFGAWDMAALADTVLRVLRSEGRGSALAAIAKRAGAAVYGKLAERYQQTDAVFAVAAPSAEYLPFVDAGGNEVPYLWARRVDRYSAHQHIDVAAVITARARSRLYEGIADLTAAGGRVVAADTDGLLTTIDPRPVLGDDAETLGAWRYEGFDSHAIVARRKLYAFGSAARAAGARIEDRRAVEWIARGEVVELHGKRIAPGWLPGAIVRDRTVRLRR